MNTVSATAIDLLVLHDLIGPVNALLGAEARDRTRLIGDDALTACPHLRGLEQVSCASVDRRIISLPMDGPRPAALVVLAGLGDDAHGAIVAPAAAAGGPPPWWSLDLVAGAEPVAVDVRRTTWHSPFGLWWTDRSGPVWLPLRVDARAHRRAAASLLRSLHEPVPDDPVTQRLDRLAGGGHGSDPSLWDRVLCANYVHRARAHLRQRARDRAGWAGL